MMKVHPVLEALACWSPHPAGVTLSIDGRSGDDFRARLAYRGGTCDVTVDGGAEPRRVHAELDRHQSRLMRAVGRRVPVLGACR